MKNLLDKLELFAEEEYVKIMMEKVSATFCHEFCDLNNNLLRLATDKSFGGMKGLQSNSKLYLYRETIMTGLRLFLSISFQTPP